MNKLRRPRPTPSPSSSSSSRLAIQTTTPGALVRNPGQSARITLPATSSTSMEFDPRSTVEHYWAARALTAEAVLSARLMHHRELQSASYTHDVRRSRDLAALSKVHEAMHAKMEKFVLALLACLIFFVVLVAYLLAQTHRSTSSKGNRASRWWAGMGFPSHFTVPILSPFTSVVEHETSVVGRQTIAIFLVVLAAFGYAIFRHWVHSSMRMVQGRSRS